jgi:hypothetical protein
MKVHNAHEFVYGLSHEIAHDFGLKLLPAGKWRLWEDSLNNDLGDLDLGTVLKLWPEGQPLEAFWKGLKADQPKLYLQLSGIIQNWNKSAPRWLVEDPSRENFEKASKQGVKIKVPNNPITSYATSTADEAFAEAVAMMVTNGPGAIPTVVRSWLNVIFEGQLHFS